MNDLFNSTSMAYLFHQKVKLLEKTVDDLKDEIKGLRTTLSQKDNTIAELTQRLNSLLALTNAEIQISKS